MNPKHNFHEYSSDIKQIDGVYTPEDRALIPEQPGVYIYKDLEGNILYVGKAKNLRKRVASYFVKTPVYLKTHLLVQQIKIIDIILVQNESEALFLEATLIKKYLPKFNINFKDGKFYPYIKVTIKDKFPRIFITRNKIEDGQIYFGPYVSAGVVRANLEFIQKIFKLRTCRILPKKECLEYHMGRCSAPCIQKVSEQEYKEQIEGALKFLSGDKEELISNLQEKMKKASLELLFEKAQIYKDQLDAVLSLEERQNVYLSSSNNIDIVGVASQSGSYGIAVSIVRQGKLTGKLGFTVKQSGQNSIEEIIEEFITNRYLDEENNLNAVIIGGKYNNLADSLTEWFHQNDVELAVRIPKDEQEESLYRLAEKNSLIHLERVLSEPDLLEVLTSIQKELKLKNFPSTIEGFDVAKLDGTLATGVMVQFQGGEPKRKEYRMFHIRQKNQQDDYAAIYESVYRRYKRLLNEKKSFPQLIVIDGGKGQLNAACDALQELDINSIDILSIAKQEEELFLPNRKSGILLPKNSAVLHLIQRVRDESHRFSQYQLHQRMDKKIKQ